VPKKSGVSGAHIKTLCKSTEGRRVKTRPWAERNGSGATYRSMKPPGIDRGGVENKVNNGKRIQGLSGGGGHRGQVGEPRISFGKAGRQKEKFMPFIAFTQGGKGRKCVLSSS